MFPNIDVASIPRPEIPKWIGWTAALEAEFRLRLMETSATPAPEPSRQLDPDEAARIMGTTKRWLLEKTRGLRFRTDFSRKVVRFDSAGLKTWGATRGRR